MHSSNAFTLQGYGERLSSPCRQQSNALRAVISRECISNLLRTSLTRSKDCFFSTFAHQGDVREGGGACDDDAEGVTSV